MSLAPVSSSSAPAAIGPYSQAIRGGNLVFCSGQIALHPETGELVNATLEDEVHQVFRNLGAVATAAGGTLASAAKLTLYLADLGNFAIVNRIMAEYFQAPYPARATIGVVALPRGARFEADAVLVLS
jgi:reactive intermediate/imine deaminase